MVGELGIFSTLVHNLNTMGFYGFILPWLFIFAIVFGLLGAVAEKTKMDKRVNGLIALVVAFFITGYTNIGVVFLNIFGISSMILAGALMIVLFFALFGIRFGATWEWALAAIIIGLILFFAVGGAVWVGIRLTNDVIALLFMIFIVALAVMFVTREGKPQG